MLLYNNFENNNSKVKPNFSFGHTEFNVAREASIYFMINIKRYLKF